MASITLKVHCLFKNVLGMSPAQIHLIFSYTVTFCGEWLIIVPLALWVWVNVNCQLLLLTVSELLKLNTKS